MGKDCALTQNTKRDVAPHTTTNIPSLSKAVETTPSTSVHGDGHNTEQSRSARRIPTHVPNFPILKERPLLLIWRLKLPGNVAHRNHTQHIHSARPHTMASLPAQAGPAKHQAARSSSQKSANVPCFSAMLNATRPETLRFVRVSPLARLKAFYLFYESDCRYETNVRFPENLQRFALCCTLSCTDVALRCNETPQLLLETRHGFGAAGWGSPWFGATVMTSISHCRRPEGPTEKATSLGADSC